MCVHCTLYSVHPLTHKNPAYSYSLLFTLIHSCPRKESGLSYLSVLYVLSVCLIDISNHQSTTPNAFTSVRFQQILKSILSLLFIMFIHPVFVLRTLGPKDSPLLCSLSQTHRLVFLLHHGQADKIRPR
jgi:hypothetical protein